jgi:hypothetical protein
MAYTKYSLTPANNNAAPPDGAPEGMLPSAVNDTLRDMMAQIRDVGDGVRGGTYTMTAPVITGGSITGMTITNSTITGSSNAPRVVSIASASTITPTSATADEYVVTALAASPTIAAPSGSPVDGQQLIIRIKDNGTARALTWTTTSGGFRAIGSPLPATTVAGKVLYVGCIYNSQDSFWDVVGISQQS